MKVYLPDLLSECLTSKPHSNFIYILFLYMPSLMHLMRLKVVIYYSNIQYISITNIITNIMQAYIIIIIVMFIFMCYLSREHIALSFYKSSVNIELGKTNR